MSTHENGGRDRPMAHGKPNNLRLLPNKIDKTIDALGKVIDDLIEERDRYSREVVRAADVESDLRRELDTYQNGYQGACMTCEPVAQQNTELREEVEQYQWLLEQAKTLRQDNMRMREAVEAVCNEVGWLWLLDETKKLLAVALQTSGNPAPQDVAKRGGDE